jgi:quercetin dioxygenase-like cupin family protein
MRRIVCGFAALAAVVAVSAANSADAPQVTRKPLLQHDATNAGQTFQLIDVVIPVGGREGKHTHPGDLIAYVESGDVTLFYEGEPNKSYKAGESFFIPAGHVHEGINMGSAPAHVVASYIGPKGQPLTTQVDK